MECVPGVYVWDFDGLEVIIPGFMVGEGMNPREDGVAFFLGTEI